MATGDKTTQKNIKQNIGILGSSFNPPHNGHHALIKDLCKKGVFDQIWIIPVFNHAFGKKLADFDHRLKMLKLLCADLPKNKYKILTIEKTLNKTPSYTYDVVKALLKQNDNIKLSLILGSDIKPELNRWHRYTELTELVNFYFIPRQGYEISPYPKVSSSEIRNNLHNRKSITGLTLPAIEKYLLEHKIYS